MLCPRLGKALSAPRTLRENTRFFRAEPASQFATVMALTFGPLAVLGALGGASLFTLSVGARAFSYQWSLKRVPRRPLAQAAAAAGIPGLEDVAFEGERGVVIRGWHKPTRNGASVILAHGLGGNREELVPEARALADAGFGILLFDWPGQGESGGRSEWGQAERFALGSAVSYLERRGELARGRLGALGFSFGGIFVAQVAASDQRLCAVALSATPNDLVELRRWQHRRWGLLSQGSGLLAGRLIFHEDRELDPIRVIGKLSPRPLLLIGGETDETVPRFMTDSLFQAAREPKSLYLIAGAGHGNFHLAAPAVYEQRLREFFQQALL